MRTIPCHGSSGPVTPDLGELRPNPAPAWGGLTRVDPLTGLAGGTRERVHENNLRIRWGDVERYRAYLEDYLRGALACRTSAELRAHGEPARPEAGLEEGRTLAETMDFEKPWNAAMGAWFRATRELGGHVLELEGKPVPLEAFFELSLAAKVRAAGRALGGRLSTRSGAQVDGALRAGGASLSATSAGRVTLGLDTGVAGVEVTAAGGRVESVAVKVRPAPLVAVQVKRSSGSAEAALSAGGKLGGKTPGAPAIELEARAAVGVNLLSAETVRWALSKKSYWNGEK